MKKKKYQKLKESIRGDAEKVSLIEEGKKNRY